MRNCNLSGAAGEAIGAALLTNKTLTDLKYGARYFAYLFFCTASVQNKTLCLLITFLPPFFFAACPSTTRSPKQRGSRSQKVLLPANRFRTSSTVLVLCGLLPYFYRPPRCRTKLAYNFSLPSPLQLDEQPRDNRSSVDQDRRRCCCQQIAAEPQARCSFFGFAYLFL